MVGERGETAIGVATVQGTDGDDVVLLFRRDRHGEATLCCLSREYWGDHDVIPGQYLQMEWNPDDDSVPLKVVFPEEEPLSESASGFVRDAREVLGLHPRDRVVIVVGANRTGPTSILMKGLKERIGPVTDEKLDEAVRHMVLKSAGWGELMLLPKLLSCLHSLGIRPTDIEYRLCETTSRSFDPSLCSDRHVIFVGSIKSNDILKTHYWSRLSANFANEYDFEDASLTVRGKDERSDLLLKYDVSENIPDDALGAPEGIHIQDYFLFSRLPNPDSNPPGRYVCILLCGVGTIGTGYAGLTAGGRRSLAKLHAKFGNGPFEIVGRVTMKGMFNPESDPVVCVFDGKNECEQMLLPKAMSSPQIFDPEDVYTEEDLRQDLMAAEQS